MKHRITADHAALVTAWLRGRGGLLVWRSVDLCDPGKSWTTPVLGEDGQPVRQPSWQAAASPARVITSADEVEVVIPKRVRKFRVATRIGASGVRVKLTDASSAKLRAALEKAGPESWHEFNYDTQEALVFVPGRVMPLAEWEEE